MTESSSLSLALTKRHATSKDIKRAFEDATNNKISCRTVRRKLLKSGLSGCVAARKPLHIETHKKKTLDWSQKRKDWTPQQSGGCFSQMSLFLS